MNRRPNRPLAVLETRLAVRAYVPRSRPHHPRPVLEEPELVLVFDSETRTDSAQALLFGSYRIYTRAGVLRQEGLIEPDDLDEPERRVLREYVAEHPAANGGHLRLRSRAAFLREVLWPIAYKARARVVCYNAPFDFSRLAVGWRRARNGGFSLRLYESVDAEGRRWPDHYRPDLRIKALGSKRNFISFTSPRRLDPDLRDGRGAFRGRFLDLHTLVYALTDRSLSLDAAAEYFSIEERKHEVTEHGVLTPEYVDYNRRDVELTWQVYQAAVVEWRRHPVALAPEQGYSPAALSKAYLEAIGVTPPSARSDVSPERLGQATSAYYGGRTECRIRGVPLPVRYVDFSSMYPTVFALLRLWEWVTAERLVATDATEEARRLLQELDRDRLHDPLVWPALAGVFCRVRPAGDLLPMRARFGADPDDSRRGSLAWTIALNELEADEDMWFTLADLVVARLLGPTTPTILEAFRVAPVGRLTGLRPTKLRGSVAVDPRRDDLFRFAIEERARVRRDLSLPKLERDRLEQFLKTFANGGAYGIFAEFRQLEPVPGGRRVRAYGLWPIDARVATPEEPGAYCFPPLAASVTGAARLLLGLLQADVEAMGGAYVACDTDSLFVVSSQSGGLVACPGGRERTAAGQPALRALSWDDVDEIAGRLNALNPYRPRTVSYLVKVEDENFDAGTGRPRELYCLATSPKRYVLYARR